ncbi:MULTISPECIES: long-chain-fatty-acid--CoA ligase [Ureibacillus]|uniref:Long-chain acyl-CoA synthetase n=1 Tax=Ureibacillus thermosphaericus TaxID=51173 RepID=A0A840PM23_URETH|nr:long-chain-fatty-acid--CoA ligase [Ureibacillus thermosphaericus]MBB5149465.1 long-chain acyl-CoA synthetase [Ureibacillus thermosphaericus]NKZ32295.1 long-chain-fatty-acid--CoA ligase [Ureibacillus thermosphaericus]
MNLVKKVREQSLNHPEKIAYIFEGRSTTYGEFEDKVSSLAFSMNQLGIQKGDHVALIFQNCPHFLIAYYALMRIGAVSIPINPMYTLDEMSYIVDNGDVKWIIAGEDSIGRINQLSNKFSQIKGSILCDKDSSHLFHDRQEGKYHFYSDLIKHSYSMKPVSLEADDIAIILYTSGTTGHPKGVMLTHGNLYANARDVGDYFLFSEEDRVIATLPFYHVFALTVVLNVPLSTGATILIAPRFSPKYIFQLAKEYHATVFAGVPTMYSFLHQYKEGEPSSFSSLRLAISGGAPLPIKVLENFEARFNIPIFEGYGLSEAAPVTCFNSPTQKPKPGSIGTSIPNVINKVVDDQGNDVAIGEVGELICKGPNVMKGYYKSPEETDKAIRDGWLYTGDLARQDEEGYIYIVDRKKDLIIVGGYNVYPREVEEVLYTHPKVLEAAVVGFSNEDYGEEVHAFIVLKEEAYYDELLQHCEKHLATYKIPEAFHIIQSLPKNSTGKILKRHLKERIERKVTE